MLGVARLLILPLRIDSEDLREVLDVNALSGSGPIEPSDGEAATEGFREAGWQSGDVRRRNKTHLWDLDTDGSGQRHHRVFVFWDSVEPHGW
jgi:hypothetical protein